MKASKYENLSMTHRLQNFLLAYRTTPHSTTNVAPCELFPGGSICTRLDLLKPDLQEHVEAKQAQQKEQHDTHARCPVFGVDQNVMVKNRHAGPSWIPGKVMQQVGPVTYHVISMLTISGSVMETNLRTITLIRNLVNRPPLRTLKLILRKLEMLLLPQLQ